MSKVLNIRCADGYVLRGTEFVPDVQPQATIVICPAIFVREGFYFHFAKYVAQHGYRAITFANRGMGVSLAAETNLWKHQLRHWGELDLPAVIEFARSTAPEKPLYLVGHSMGGQLAALSPASLDVDAIVTVAATHAWWGHWPRPYRWGILAWYSFIPLVGRVLPKFPASRLGLGPNVSSSVVRDWARWGRNRNYFMGPFGIQPQMANYRGRVLAWSFTDDERLGLHAAVEALHRHYFRASVTHLHVDPAEFGLSHLGHFGYFRPHLGPALWEQTIAWLDS
ncbi:MAG: alpha/beta fold hydrolase [Proteobacteria bacterium]|jgi:predicted alpha/beta hydrolase|nr:alpha/beta fold hydrolase [Pseudomonadota bacterium]